MSIWSIEQEQALRALGYTLYQPVSAASFSFSDTVSTNPVPTKQNENVPTITGDVLWHALSRAVGGADLSSLAIDIELLRREPGRKRALWPQLRSLLRAR